VFAALQAFEKRGCQTILSGNLLLPFKSDANLPKKGLVVKPFLALNHRRLASAYRSVIFFPENPASFMAAVEFTS